MALHDERMRERLHHLFVDIAVEPTVSYPDIIDAVRRINPPESVWGLARDIATHMDIEPDSVFFPDEAHNIRRGMAERWVHSVLGEGDGRSERESAVVAAWENMQFAGVPPIRNIPLRYFSRRYEQASGAVYPLGERYDMKVSVKE